MYLAIGIFDDYFWAINVTSKNPEFLAPALFISMENGSGCYPRQIFLIQDDYIINKFTLGKEYK